MNRLAAVAALLVEQYMKAHISDERIIDSPQVGGRELGAATHQSARGARSRIINRGVWRVELWGGSQTCGAV